MKKSVSRPTPIKPDQAARLTPEAAQAIADYQAFMKHMHGVDVSINASISILVRLGWRSIHDEAAQQAAQS